MAGCSGGSSSSALNEVESSIAGDLTEDEHQIYDRQIRLWGHEAQNKLRNANVLLAGITGLGCEIAKNIVLAGIKSLTLIDPNPIRDEDAVGNFLLSAVEKGTSRAKASFDKVHRLNPMVELRIEEGDVNDRGADFFKAFDVVIVVDHDYETTRRVNEICRDNVVRFVGGAVYGWNGYAFFDFNQHNFLIKHAPPKLADVEADGEYVFNVEDEEPMFVKKPIAYVSYNDALNVNWDSKPFIRKAKRILPSSYFPIREKGVLNGEEEHDLPLLEQLWRQELQTGNGDPESQDITPDLFDFFYGPQFAPASAIVGGVIGQEVIKAISENKDPLLNTFFYSAIDHSGRICKLPPV